MSRASGDSKTLFTQGELYTRAKQKLIVDDLYKHNGAYSFGNGFNKNAIIALLCGILPNVPGFLLQVKLVSSTAFPGWINNLYNYAWFVGFFISGLVYWSLMYKFRVESYEFRVASETHNS